MSIHNHISCSSSQSLKFCTSIRQQLHCMSSSIYLSSSNILSQKKTHSRSRTDEMLLLKHSCAVIYIYKLLDFYSPIDTMSCVHTGSGNTLSVTNQVFITAVICSLVFFVLGMLVGAVFLYWIAIRYACRSKNSTTPPVMYLYTHTFKWGMILNSKMLLMDLKKEHTQRLNTWHYNGTCLCKHA